MPGFKKKGGGTKRERERERHDPRGTTPTNERKRARIIMDTRGIRRNERAGNQHRTRRVRLLKGGRLCASPRFRLGNYFSSSAIKIKTPKEVRVLTYPELGPAELHLALPAKLTYPNDHLPPSSHDKSPARNYSSRTRKERRPRPGGGNNGARGFVRY